MGKDRTEWGMHAVLVAHEGMGADVHASVRVRITPHAEAGLSRMKVVPVYRHEFHEQYCAAKACYQRIGHEYEVVFARAVGGTCNAKGCDVQTDVGRFEFAAAPNTKNSAGAAHDRDTGNLLVQVTGPPRVGWMTAAAFLYLHGIREPEARAHELVAVAQARALQWGRQLSIV